MILLLHEDGFCRCSLHLNQEQALRRRQLGAVVAAGKQMLVAIGRGRHRFSHPFALRLRGTSRGL